MPLPFSRNDGKRQFQCFCCGILLPSPPAFKDHIKANHEEGREYIICPLERCGMPVRCVRSHFKAIHPHDVMPKNCQMKALLWRDPKDPRRRKKKVSFEEGYFPSAKNRKNLHYRSSWERQIYEVLENFDDVVKYEVESLAIEYFFKGEKHNYLPDIKLYFRDGHKEIWEIKPSNQTGISVNEAKWVACMEFCKSRGWDFKVITEMGLERLNLGIPL